MFRFVLALATFLCGAGTAFADGMDDMNEGGWAMTRGEFAPAVELLTNAIASGDLGPEYTAASYLSRGQAHYHLGDHEQAIRDFTASMESGVMGRRHTGIAYGSRASAYRQLGQFDAAIADFGQAIEREVGGAAIYFHRGLAYEGKGERAKAEADFIRAYEMEPDNPAYREKMTELGHAID